MDQAEGDDRPAKRQKFVMADDGDEHSTLLTVPVSPPRKRSVLGDATATDEGTGERAALAEATRKERAISNEGLASRPGSESIVPSPIQLSHVEGLPARNNADTASLHDILGHPLIKECWAFNYLIDVDFLLEHFDEDTRDSVALHVVHGSWKKDSANRIDVEDAVSRHKNANAIIAYMPEAFGTHHSKAFVLFRHDDLAQVVICTANFIQQDWRMCQAVWRSPLLPLFPSSVTDDSRPSHVGRRFKFDFLSYLRSYGRKLESLITQLEKYDFSDVKAALVASVPCRQRVTTSPNQETLWGWLGLKDALSSIPVHGGNQAHVVVQISSVATLGTEDSWLRKTLFAALTTNSNADARIPRFSIVFPTPDDVRRTIDGYACGGSIHMKISSVQQARQLQYLKPMLCRWAAEPAAPAIASSGSSARPIVREAGRRRAGPHIKTYLRFSDAAMTRLDWALTTSANLSKQAWGAAANAAGEVRICSYELGVVVWPGLWEKEVESGGKVEMVPVFKTDAPDLQKATNVEGVARKGVRVGLRMPYDLPLVPYSNADEPWCATKSYTEPDWMGRVWQIGGR